MKNFLLFCCLTFFGSEAIAQQHLRWRIGVNPLSLAESQLSLGPAVAYRVNRRLECWSEASLIFANSYMPNRWTDMTGLRLILQTRYYLGESQDLFIAPEFRWKHYSFNNRLNFFNPRTFDTLKNLSFREAQSIIGGAFVLGKQYLIGRKSGLQLELTAGLGVRHRFIERNRVPAGYLYYPAAEKGFALAPDYESDNRGTVLFPLGARLMWPIQ